MTDIEMVKKITGEADEDLLSLLLQMAEEKLLSLTNRTKMIPAMNPAKRDWAIIAYNRLGMEGESSRSQAGISSSFVEIPEDIKETIKRLRIARVSGHAYEKITTENIPPQTEGTGQG